MAKIDINVPWWRTSFGVAEVRYVSESIRREKISQGSVTRTFEQKLERYLSVEHAVATSSGSSALLIALMALGIGPGDEVIVPNRTWIATAHAAAILGARIVCVDVEQNRPVLDAGRLESAITMRTKAIIIVHMNGRAVDIGSVMSIARRHRVPVIEDAAQALGSKNRAGFLGAQADIGCFSLSVAKIISSGQGGFAVTNSSELARRMRLIRTHGVENVHDPKRWPQLGFNFRYTDVAASLGIAQLRKINGRISRLIDIHCRYESALRGSCLRMIPVDVDSGEVPLYVEALVDKRDEFVAHLARCAIESRPFYPDIDRARYLKIHGSFENSRRFERDGVYLPSGPCQSLSVVKLVRNAVNKLS